MKTYGTDKEVIQSVNISDHLDAVKQSNGTSANISYTQTASLDTVRAAAPALGSHSALVPAKAILFDRTFTDDGSGTIKVTLVYAQPANTSSSGVNIGGNKNYSLSTKRCVTSIVNHPDYKGVPGDGKKVAIAIIKGTQSWDKVSCVWSKDGSLLKFTSDANGEPFQTAVVNKITDKKTKELVNRCFAGKTSWAYTSYIWTVSETSSGVLAANAKINRKVTNVPGPAPKAEDGTHWEITSITSKKSATDGFWNIDTVYQTVLDEEDDANSSPGTEKK